MSSITNSYSSSLYSSYYQNPINKTTSETYKQSIKQNDTNSVNPMNQDSKTALPSDKKALEIAKERISFLVIQEEIQRILENEAINVFERALDYQELIEKRFLAGLNLSAISLLGELGSLSKILSALSDIQTEENRLQALRDFESGKPYQKIFMEI